MYLILDTHLNLKSHKEISDYLHLSKLKLAFKVTLIFLNKRI